MNQPEPQNPALLEAYASAFQQLTETALQELATGPSEPTYQDYVEAATELQRIRRCLRREAEAEFFTTAQIATLERFFADCGADSATLARRGTEERRRRSISTN